MTVVNRVLATLLALALLLGGLLAVVEVVLAALGRRPWLVPHPDWTSWLTDQSLDSGAVRAALVGAVVLGLVLLVLALRRGRPGALPLPARVESVRTTASRRGIERTLRAAATRPDGVRDARVRARRRTVRVRAATALREPGDLQSRVTEAVSQRLEELGLAGTLRPRVTVSRGAGR
ncbi:DUF6286 domain-containing protein [Geodermatophilus poikilotrophus]|uniref:DUF6286 domain-containing protein n=1 Tax=Geodermatophilus poikilotrophus TaxID=1333667 RepID=A0A1I0HIY6_9ACTN|nr:DUF6286 domain-containing protein [Geodermatophilus poikilotrophus]SET83970.1 hypothetical protein SAMN04488546_3909 [Geodermatophilus poikilotrophus]